jgi:crotonobetainyl-CoA:carnitine CoA-transferase CaiB-like acyl-CoA transferase
VSDGQGGRPTPLKDVRVVEISDRIAGSYCGKLLVDAGAEVRKIEPPQGDSLRRFSASGSFVPDGTNSPLFGYLNAGKRSLTWSAANQRHLDELAGADIIVVAATRSQAAQLGWRSLPGPSSSPSPTSAGPVRMPSEPPASSPCRRGLA